MIKNFDNWNVCRYAYKGKNYNDKAEKILAILKESGKAMTPSEIAIAYDTYFQLLTYPLKCLVRLGLVEKTTTIGEPIMVEAYYNECGKYKPHLVEVTPKIVYYKIVD